MPGVPENGRTIYRGHLFVGDVLLNESGMENHPLTPMKDANLVRVLQRQTKSPVGLIRYDTIALGAAAVRTRIEQLRAEGVRFAIADALSDRDLYVLGEACAACRSSPAARASRSACPRISVARSNCPNATTRRRCRASKDSRPCWPAARRRPPTRRSPHGATRPSFRIDPLAASRGEPVVEQALTFARSHLPQPVLIYATATPDEVKAVQQALGVDAAGHLVEATLAAIARGLRDLGVRSSSSPAAKRPARSCRRST